MEDMKQIINTDNTDTTDNTTNTDTTDNTNNIDDENNIEDFKELKFIFDVETTGLPIRERNRRLDYYNLKNFEKSRLVSISWIIIDNDNNVISKKNCYIKPDTFDVPYQSTLIHGLDIDYLNKNGVSIHQIFLDLKKIFMDSLNPITKIISHNIDFDINILKSELYRYEYIEFLRFIQDIETFCTMLNAKKKMKVGKWPRLSEAYKFFYNDDIQNAHQAEFDTFYFFEIYKKLII